MSSTAEYMREFRRKHREAGLCRYCNRVVAMKLVETDEGMRYRPMRVCAVHRESARITSNRFRNRLRRAELCSHCANKVVPGYKKCQKHLDDFRQYAAKRRQERNREQSERAGM